MSEYRECTLEKEEIVELVIQRVEKARAAYYNFMQKGKYQTDEERVSVITRLIAIETLAFEMGIIDTCTI